MVLLIDNYDSFVYNLYQYLLEIGETVKVARNNKITLDEIENLKPTHIILSPGPCTPDEAGISLELVRYFADKVPILGVCLGHQSIGQAFGGQVVRAAKPMHGKKSFVEHDGRGAFEGLPQPLTVGRYHSLVVEKKSLPPCLEISALSPEGEIMGLRHTCYPVEGVQFHPESILTRGGHRLLKNFLNQGGKHASLYHSN